MKITQKDNGKYKTRVYIGQTIDGKKHWIFAEREKYFVELDGGSGNGSVPEIRTLGDAIERYIYDREDVLSPSTTRGSFVCTSFGSFSKNTVIGI